MKLQKAIEILKDELPELPHFYGPDFIDAVKLGIEALKRVKRYERMWAAWHMDLLPGETEE